MILLLAVLAVPDLSGAPGLFSDLNHPHPLPSAVFASPFPRDVPETGELFLRAGAAAGDRGCFQCRGNGATLGRTFTTAGWFSREGWFYRLGAGDFFSLTMAEDSAARTALLSMAGDRLALAFHGRESDGSPAVLWVSPELSCAAGPRGAGAGFAIGVARGLFLGPAFTHRGPWVKCSAGAGPVRFTSGPGMDRSGDVVRSAGLSIEGRGWLLGGVLTEDSLRLGGAAELQGIAGAAVTWPGPGCRLVVRPLDFASVEGSTDGRGGWAAGVSAGPSWGTLSLWGRRDREWSLGVGLEVGRGRMEPLLVLPRR
jgi:hypothetical protein